MQIANLSTQKPGAARNTTCVFCFVDLRDPSLFGAAETAQFIITYSISSCLCCSICNLRSYRKGHILLTFPTS